MPSIRFRIESIPVYAESVKTIAGHENVCKHVFAFINRSPFGREPYMKALYFEECMKERALISY